MNMNFKKALSVVGVLALLTMASLGASAQCGGIDQLRGKLKPQAWLGGSPSGSLLLASEREEHANDGEGIVGFWRVTFISKGNTGNPPPFNPPDEAILDHGFAQWHSDGTEIMNSNRTPATGSFCLGIWKKVGPSHYKLNHFALGFDDGVTLGYNNIREDVFLSEDGDSFSGHVSLSLFSADGHAGPVLNGDVVGTRIKVNTTLGDIL
jgi:hypothetical protein